MKSLERLFDMSIDIEATPEHVWKALTDAGELTRWFPLQARVTPGTGGRMFWGWDNHWAWESQIEVWELHKRLTLVETRPAFDVNGNPLPGPAQDSHVVIRSATGEQFSGTVAWHNPGRDLFVRVSELNDGGFRVSTWRGGGQTGVQVWLTSYDEAHSARIRQFGENVQQLVNRLF